MSSTKCPVCGLVNFAEAESCKRCNASIRPRKVGEQGSTVCPKCNSEDTQSFQMAYKTGTTSGVIGMGTYSDGGLGVTRGTVKSQSDLARSLKPPTNPAPNVVIVLCVLVSAAILFLAFLVITFIPFAVASSSVIWWTVGISFAAPLIAIGVSYMTWQSRRAELRAAEVAFRTAMHSWSHSWICLRCGGSWLIH